MQNDSETKNKTISDFDINQEGFVYEEDQEKTSFDNISKPKVKAGNEEDEDDDSNDSEFSNNDSVNSLSSKNLEVEARLSLRPLNSKYSDDEEEDYDEIISGMNEDHIPKLSKSLSVDSMDSNVSLLDVRKKKDHKQKKKKKSYSKIKIKQKRQQSFEEKDNDEEVSSLRKKLEQCKQEIFSINAQLASLKEKNKDLARQLIEYQRESEKVNMEKEMVEIKKSLLQNEFDNLNKQFNIIKNKYSRICEDRNELSCLNAALNIENERLESENEV